MGPLANMDKRLRNQLQIMAHVIMPIFAERFLRQATNIKVQWLESF